MTITFEHDFSWPHIPNLVCMVKGHEWKKYIRPKKSGNYSIFETFYGGTEPTKQCDRCGETRYTKLVERKIKTIQWSRYAEKFGTGFAEVKKSKKL